MTLDALKQYCIDLGFEPVIIHNQFYMCLNSNIYSGPTLIYYPYNKGDTIYITPELHIIKYHHIMGRIPKEYYYYGNCDPREAFFSIEDNYTKYTINDDEQIKKAITKLAEQMKTALISMRLKNIKGDFE